MKKYSWFLAMAMMAFACQLQNEEIVSSEKSSAANLEDYSVSSSTSDGKTFTFNLTINQGSKAISHVMFNFSDCDGQPLNLSNVLSTTVNGTDASALFKSGTGQGDACFSVSTANSIKLDQGYSQSIVVVITLDTKSSGGVVYIKAGSSNGNSGGGCFGPYNFNGNCEPDECFEFKHETAWSAGQRYVSKGNWATVTPYAEGTVNIFAGQHHHAGTATFSAVSNGKVTISIVLNEGWSLDGPGNTVKIQDYASKPSGNPSPGRFAHKGSSLTVEVPANNYYGIHLDVVGKRKVDCPK